MFDGGSKQTSISTACFQLPSNPDRTTKSRQLPTFSKVGSRVPRLAFPPLNTVAVYSRLFNGGNKQTSISTAYFQPSSNPDRPAKSRKPQTSQKVGSRVPRLAFPPLNTVAVYSRLFDGGSKQTSISTACFQLSSTPDRPAKPSQPQTFQKVRFCRAPRVLCFIEFQPSFNPDRTTKPSQPQTSQKVGICRAPRAH